MTHVLGQYNCCFDLPRAQKEPLTFDELEKLAAQISKVLDLFGPHMCSFDMSKVKIYCCTLYTRLRAECA